MAPISMQKTPAISSPPQNPHIHNLPDELLVHMVSFLDVPSQARVAQSDHQMYAIATDDQFLQRKCEFAAKHCRLGAFLRTVPLDRRLSAMQNAAEVTPEEFFTYIESPEFESDLEDFSPEIAQQVSEFAKLVLATHVDQLLKTAFPDKADLEREEQSDTDEADIEMGTINLEKIGQHLCSVIKANKNLLQSEEFDPSSPDPLEYTLTSIIDQLGNLDDETLKALFGNLLIDGKTYFEVLENLLLSPAFQPIKPASKRALVEIVHTVEAHNRFRNSFRCRLITVGICVAFGAVLGIAIITVSLSMNPQNSNENLDPQFQQIGKLFLLALFFAMAGGCVVFPCIPRIADKNYNEEHDPLLRFDETTKRLRYT